MSHPSELARQRAFVQSKRAGARCEALAFHNEHKSTPRYEQCAEVNDVRSHAGHRLCWVHRQAADFAGRTEPLKFVGDGRNV